MGGKKQFSVGMYVLRRSELSISFSVVPLLLNILGHLRPDRRQRKYARPGARLPCARVQRAPVR